VHLLTPYKASNRLPQIMSSVAGRRSVQLPNLSNNVLLWRFLYVVHRSKKFNRRGSYVQIYVKTL